MTKDKEEYLSVKQIIAILQRFEPRRGYYVGFSGGKDSIVLADIVKRAGVGHTLNYSVTTVCYPEVMRFIKDAYPECIWHYPKYSMWQIIERWGLPMMHTRLCCKMLKECHGKAEFKLLGVRSEESLSRASRNMLEFFYHANGLHFSPLKGWSTEQIWEYIRRNNLSYPSLYDDGFARIGCIGCPFNSEEQTQYQFELYPKYKELYLRAIEKAILRGRYDNFKSADQVLAWWISKKKQTLFDAQNNQYKISI